MLRILPILCLALFVSCSKKEADPIVLYPAGFFSVKKELYFSDGERFYCTFVNWEHFYTLRGSRTPPKSKIITYSDVPKDMKFIQYCNPGILTEKFFE